MCLSCVSLPGVYLSVCVWDRKISSVSEERNKNAEGLNNKATELLVCPGGRGRYRGILSLKKATPVSKWSDKGLCRKGIAIECQQRVGIRDLCGCNQAAGSWP